jgi:heme exporter protein CcmD
VNPWFESWSEFLAMSGYGRYLWPSFALGFGVVALNAWLAARALANARREARRRLEIPR